MGNGSGCIFCKLVSGQIPSERLYEDDQFVCIRDLQPQAKTHLLMISKQHVTSLDDLYAPESRATPVGAAALEVATHIAR